MNWNANARVAHATCAGKGCDTCGWSGSETGVENERRVRVHEKGFFIDDGPIVVHRVDWLAADPTARCGATPPAHGRWFSSLHPVSCAACVGAA